MNKEWEKMFQGRDRTRELVRIRDRHRCNKCKRRWYEGERRFDVHHLKGLCGKKSLKYDRLCDISGLITLCHKCHLGDYHVRSKMIEAYLPPRGVNKKRALDMRKSGKTYKEIAKKLGCSYQYIFRVIKNMGKTSKINPNNSMVSY